MNIIIYFCCYHFGSALYDFSVPEMLPAPASFLFAILDQNCWVPFLRGWNAAKHQSLFRSGIRSYLLQLMSYRISQWTDEGTSNCVASWENRISNMMAARNQMQRECWLSQSMYFLEAGEQRIKRRGWGWGHLRILCVVWIWSLGCITDGFPISLWTWWGASQHSSQLCSIVKWIFFPFMWSNSKAVDMDYLCLWIFLLAGRIRCAL